VLPGGISKAHIILGDKVAEVKDLTFVVRVSGEAFDFKELRPGTGWVMEDLSRYDSTLRIRISQLSMLSGTISDTVASLSYSAYLAASDVAELSLDSLTINESDPNFMECLATPIIAGGAQLKLDPSCGSTALRGVLQQPVLSASVHPHPVAANADVFHLRVAAELATPVEISIYDMRGVQIMKEARSISSGESHLTISTAGMGSGVYRLVLKHEQGLQSLPLVVE
jgi:hypothetical protein